MTQKSTLLFALFCLLSLQAFSVNDDPEGLKKGDTAPEIKAKDHQGNDFTLSEELKKGKVVLIFYRGSWCPHCNKHLAKLQDSINLISKKGATVIAVTPEKSEFVQGTAEKFDDSFRILYDQDLSIMNDYGVSFTLDESTFNRYKSNGLDLMEHNGNQGNQLPVPATYVIDKKGEISYVHFNEDYKNRASVSTILKNL